MDLNSSHLSAKTWFEIRRLRGNGIQSLVSIWISVLFATQPDIVRYSDDEWNDESVSTVETFNGAESVFEIVSS